MARVAVWVTKGGKSSWRVLAVSGSTRSASTNTALCHTAPLCAPLGVEVSVFDDCAVLPHFNPDEDHEPLPAPVAGLRKAIADADAVLFCTPEYAGTLPGSLKNLLDWTVGGTEFTGKPTAWVKVAADARRGEGAHATLAIVLGYVQAEVIASACRHIPISREMVGPDGLVADPAAREAISNTLRAMLQQSADLPVACTLGLEDRAERMRRWHLLVERAVPTVRRIGHQLEVQFQPGPEVHDELKALAGAEQKCCAFVAWSVTVEAEHPVLHVIAPPDQPGNIESIMGLFDAT